MNSSNSEILQNAPIVPVVAISKLEQAVPLAQALLEGGIDIIEVTLRTSVALDAISAIARDVPDIRVGAGTIVKSDQIRECIDHGANFGLSPGSSPALLQTAQQQNWNLMPGIATPSDIVLASEFGLDTLKFFPAETYGGVGALKSFSGPFPDVSFCPTGGINLGNLNNYLSLPNVRSVGGTWLAPLQLVEEGRWSEITQRCKDALALV